MILLLLPISNFCCCLIHYLRCRWLWSSSPIVVLFDIFVIDDYDHLHQSLLTATFVVVVTLFSLFKNMIDYSSVFVFIVVNCCYLLWSLSTATFVVVYFLLQFRLPICCCSILVDCHLPPFYRRSTKKFSSQNNERTEGLTCIKVGKVRGTW